jgi:hypothetical protein
MPAQLKDLPAHLKKRAVEVLLSDGLAGVTIGTLGRPFEITGVMLSSYHMSHDSPEVSHELKLIADYFGWQIWGLS